MVFIKKNKPQKIALERVSLGSTITLPYCTGGLNTKDPLPSMPAQDAIILKNMIVENDRVVTRGGYKVSATGLPSQVESLFEFRSADSTQIISCSSNKIYTGLNSSLIEIGTGFISDRWQGLMMNNYLLLFNGADAPQKYDGTTLTTNTLNGSGLTPTDLVGATNFKNRLITWQNNACGFWYGVSDAISGTLNYFDLSYITKRGGYVVACATWSYDSSGGTGLQARLVIFMSSGEAIVYEGTDPADAENWSIVGRFKVAPPISQRAILEYSGDILLVNKYDLISFSEVFSSGENPSTQSKLVGAIGAAAAAYGSNFGWQLINYPVGGLIIVNVPLGNNLFTQYVINTRSGGSSQFTNINSNCFVVFDDNLYFGGNQEVYQGLVGLDDNGNYIQFEIQNAYNNFGVNREKCLNYIIPYILADNDINFSYSLNYDFKQGELATAELLTNEGHLWDTFYWDEVYWSPEAEIKSVQYGVKGQGLYVSFRIKASVRGSQFAFYSVLYSYTQTNL